MILGVPLREVLLRIGEEVGREPEEVHRNRRILSQFLVCATVVEDDPAVGHALDLRALDHRREVALRIDAADAARNRTVLRKSPVQVVGDHAIAVFRIAEFREVLADGLVSLGAVEVVGVDHGERLVNGIGGHHHGMVRAPRLHAAFGNRQPLGEVVQLLKDEIDGDAPAEAVGRKDLAELLFKRVADDENHLAETGADGVVDRIVDDGFVVGTDAVHLFERSVAGAHACRQDQECRFDHTFLCVCDV